MEKIIRLTLVGAALGLSVSSFATFVVQDFTASKDASRNLFDQLYGPYLLILVHFFGYMIRFLLVGNIKNYELFGRYFNRDQGLYLTTICLDYLSILIGVGAASFVFNPDKYVIFISFASLVSFAATLFDRSFRLRERYRWRTIGQLLGNRGIISAAEFLVFLAVAFQLLGAWYAVIPYSILLVIDLALCRSLYFEDFEKMYDELFKVERATEFYERVASIYDRNIHEQVRLTQAGAVSVISSSCPVNATQQLKVLDLGGGTGEVSKYFANQNVEWTNVDPSRNMLEIFEAKARQLKMKASAVTARAEEYISACQESYDVVLVTFVLTSLPQPFRWSDVARILGESGKLIVADINPLHTVKRPFFEIEQADTITAIECRPVNIAALLNDCQAAKLSLLRFEEAPQAGSEYAFIAVFEKK